MKAGKGICGKIAEAGNEQDMMEKKAKFECAANSMIAAAVASLAIAANF